MFRTLSLLLFLGSLVAGDIYMHNPRGSNNRLNEQSASRANANRLFDSQNNNRGGYNVGDRYAAPAKNEEEQYIMTYFQSGASEGKSNLLLEWTNQHGCGENSPSNPNKLNCNFVIQYMCQDDDTSATGSGDSLRNGASTLSQDYTPSKSLSENRSEAKSRKDSDVKPDRGTHESWEHYDSCRTRERNKGLFAADQDPGHDKIVSSAVYTRQNPGGSRSGYECPEERDYYPYWHPSPWKDIAVLTSNKTMCEFYKKESGKPKHLCVEEFYDMETRSTQQKHSSRWNNEKECVDNNGEWRPHFNYLEKAPKVKTEEECDGLVGDKSGLKYVWGYPEGDENNEKTCLVLPPKVDCQLAPWSRVNHLGNGEGGQPLSYNWELPYFPSGNAKKCVLRMRYNISTDDYDPWNTDSRSNYEKQGGVSPGVLHNPAVQIGAAYNPLTLAINTAQFGRTFQDRSHVFKLQPRPKQLEGARIHNLNVRGKRGNIVQTYPAVEYDFVPNNLEINKDDLVHIQWTGSNTHNNGNPAGDGAAGDAGEGAGGTDRHNFVEMKSSNENFPVPFSNSTMWNNMKVVWSHNELDTTSSPEEWAKNVALRLACADYYQCFQETDCGTESVEKKYKMSPDLNNASPSFAGMVVQFPPGTHHYMCTRNNNFTNRSQKGTIIVI